MEKIESQLTLLQLQEIFSRERVTRILAKPLADNDNTKQQIYLGGGFEVLNELPFDEVTAHSDSKYQNFKSKLSFFWLASSGKFEPAPGAQLILYPDYPEVRLSGFLIGCKAAPSKYLQPLPKEQRGEKNAWNGRVLFMGVSDDRRVLAYLSIAGSVASDDFDSLRNAQELRKVGALYTLRTLERAQPEDGNTRNSLLGDLRGISERLWTPSSRMYADGSIRSYSAVNGGGYTLEALLGIRPNGRSEPDHLGWEVKAHSGDRITLMTPEPGGGYYGEHGVQAFLRKYGRQTDEDTLYFTGIHTALKANEGTQQSLRIEGFNTATKKIDNVDGGIQLVDSNGNESASWSFSSLLAHWSRKHAQTVYVKYEKRGVDPIEFRYLSPVRLGTGTDFGLFLAALASGDVVYDPAPKLTGLTTGKVKVKARSQFRMSTKKLASLYHAFETVDLHLADPSIGPSSSASP